METGRKPLHPMLGAINRNLPLFFVFMFFTLAAFGCLDLPAAATPTREPYGCLPNNTPSSPEEQAAGSAASTLVAATVNAEAARIALSATPTLNRSLTPIPPTRTPQPTSTLWRLEPSVTPVSRLRTQQFIIDQNNPPDFGLGRRRDFSSEEEQTLRRAVLNILEQEDTHDNEAFFHIWDALELDWDKDGQTETALLYSLDSSPFITRISVAMVRDGQIAALGTDWFKGEYVEHFLLRAIPISADKTALFTQLLTTTSGSGVYPQIYRNMYLWQDGQLRNIWKWEYSGGGRAGWANSWGNFETVRFLHLSGQNELDLLLSRTSGEWAVFDNPANYLFYNVRLPGELLFSWNERTQTYQLTHFYDGGRLKRIHPADFIVHVPRLTQPLTLDGRFYDWHQIEYMDALNGYGRGNWRRSPGVYEVSAAYDESYLYLGFRAATKTRIWIGLDTALAEDFENETLSEDDFLFELALSEDEPSACRLAQSLLVWSHRVEIEAAAHPWEYSDDFCDIELAIPLNWLPLKLPLVPQPGYALRPQLHPEYDRPYKDNVFTEYYPRPGALMGFALFGENETVEQQEWLRFDLLPFQPQNPATWGTLLFIADR